MVPCLSSLIPIILCTLARCKNLEKILRLEILIWYTFILPTPHLPLPLQSIDAPGCHKICTFSGTLHTPTYTRYITSTRGTSSYISLITTYARRVETTATGATCLRSSMHHWSAKLVCACSCGLGTGWNFHTAYIMLESGISSPSKHLFPLPRILRPSTFVPIHTQSIDETEDSENVPIPKLINSLLPGVESRDHPQINVRITFQHLRKYQRWKSFEGRGKSKNK